MNKTNPFTLLFGQLPLNYIDRSSQIETIRSAFESDNPLSRLFIITGVRGSGKTVTMTSIAESFEERKDWIVVDLNPETDLLEALASKIYDNAKVKRLFLEASFNISFKGIGFSIEGQRPFTNVESVLEEMLKALSKQKKKLLITIDEVVPNQYIKVFAHAFQSLLRKRFDIFLLMTGLFENVSNIQDENSLTFLYRAPKVVLEPLSLPAIAKSYCETLGCAEEDGLALAVLTKGYAFAYQLLGSLMWEQGKKKADRDVLADYDAKLYEYSYDKIWTELSPKDRTILKSIKKDGETVADFLTRTGLKKNEFSVYRDRLIKKGILDERTRGKLVLKLPRFFRFIELKRLDEDF